MNEHKDDLGSVFVLLLLLLQGVYAARKPNKGDQGLHRTRYICIYDKIM